MYQVVLNETNLAVSSSAEALLNSVPRSNGSGSGFSFAESPCPIIAILEGASFPPTAGFSEASKALLRMVSCSSLAAFGSNGPSSKSCPFYRVKENGEGFRANNAMCPNTQVTGPFHRVKEDNEGFRASNEVRPNTQVTVHVEVTALAWIIHRPIGGIRDRLRGIRRYRKTPTSFDSMSSARCSFWANLGIISVAGAYRLFHRQKRKTA